MPLTLILGGARSGKSDLAMRLAWSTGRPVLFVATMEPADEESRLRVAAHRAARPRHWRTIEAPIALLDVLTAEARAGETVVIDCVTLWISNLLMASLGDADVDAAEMDAAVGSAVSLAEKLGEWCAASAGDVFVVTNEVGSGVVPPYALGRAFRDALGSGNRVLAARAERVLQVSAGMVIDLQAIGARSIESFGSSPR
jgi:adenosylcobinamide kinase/adenosylcobinamide-phosphate guanylyltransferase